MEKFQVGDKISFYHGTRGRGGHVAAFAEVTKVNRKTVDMIEIKPSYGAGTKWRCQKSWLEENLTPRGMTILGFNGTFFG